ncbi:MAG: hypothetical protein ACI4AQ_03025 [Lachnospiraceae bacterium]
MFRRIRNVILFVVLVIFFAGTTKFIHNKILENKADRVVLRFAVTSGTYVEDQDARELVNYINKVCDYAATQEYKTLDVLIVNGNFTEDGSEDAWEYAKETVTEYLDEDTRFCVTVGGQDFMTTDEEADGASLDPYFSEKITDWVIMVNGYYFIGVSPVFSAYESKLEWLDEQLEKYTRYNSKPVFVVQPGTVKDTYYGSEQWYIHETDELEQLLEKYPTVIDFSGFSATPAQVFNSVIQKNATYVNNGNCFRNRLKLEEFGLDTTEDFFNESIGELSQCKIVEVYGDGKTRIYTMDLKTGKLYGQEQSAEAFYREINLGRKDANQEAKDEKGPFFDADFVLELTPVDGEWILEFSQAKNPEDVLLYKIVLLDKDGQKIKEYIRYGDYTVGKMSQMQKISLTDFDESASLIEITAMDFAGNYGEKIQRTIK